MRMLEGVAAMVVVLGGGLLACRSGEVADEKTEAAPAAPAQAAGSTSEAARAEAGQIFATRCFACHGAQGRGDGPASQGLTPPPRNFHDASWQAQVSDAYLEQIIKFGGAAVGKSPAMPPNPDLLARPEVVSALREHLRSLKD